MSGVIIELSPQEVQRLEAILLDDDQEDALDFIRRVLKPKLRAKTNPALDSGLGTGVIT
ncbi:MAG: hypothetical protein V1816_20060 [Pseudomonadota bacterium]